MKSKESVLKFLDSLQWERKTKRQLERELQAFFGTDNTLCNGTCEDCSDLDYSFLFTTGTENCCTEHFIDIEIYYLKMRAKNWVLITGTDLLDYVE